MLGEARELLQQQNLTLRPVQDLAEEFHIRLSNLAVEVSEPASTGSNSSLSSALLTTQSRQITCCKNVILRACLLMIVNPVVPPSFLCMLFLMQIDWLI